MPLSGEGDIKKPNVAGGVDGGDGGGGRGGGGGGGGEIVTVSLTELTYVK